MRLGRWLTALVLFSFLGSAGSADNIKVKVRSANVRRQANVVSPLLATVAEGTVLEAIGREGNWFKVRLPQGEGFILNTLVEPVPAPPPAPEPPAAPTPPPPPPPPPAPPAGVAIDHQEVKCIPADQYSRFEACPAADVSRMRLNFRAEGGPFWYFAEMKKEERCYAGILPRPKKTTKRVEYYIDAIGTAFAETRTPEYKPIVVARKSECRDKPIAAWVGSSPLTVTAPAGAPPVPVGFDPATIAGGAASAATIAGISTKTLAFAGGGVVVATVGVVAATSGGGDSGGGIGDRDQDGDGFSTGQGDCDDNNPAVKPGGAVQLANARFENPNTTCPNQTSNSEIRMPLVVSAQNNSCAAVTVNRISGTLTIVTVQGDVLRYAVGQVYSFPSLLAAPVTIAAGQNTTIRVEPILYCDNWCGIGYMETSGQLVIETSAGTFTVQTSALNRTDYPVGRP